MAADNDVLSLTEAKAAISNNAGDTNDDLLEAYVTGVSLFLDDMCGPIVIRTIDDELVDGGQPIVFLTYRPVSEVTSVEEADGTTVTTLTEQTFATIPADGYLLRAGAGLLCRMKSGSPACWAGGADNVRITYDAGRYESTTDVDERFKRAAAIVLANIYRREHGQGVSDMPAGITYMLPNAAKALLGPDLQIRG